LFILFSNLLHGATEGKPMSLLDTAHGCAGVTIDVTFDVISLLTDSSWRIQEAIRMQLVEDVRKKVLTVQSLVAHVVSYDPEMFLRGIGGNPKTTPFQINGRMYRFPGNAHEVILGVRAFPGRGSPCFVARPTILTSMCVGMPPERHMMFFCSPDGAVQDVGLRSLSNNGLGIHVKNCDFLVFEV
jgi:hypothetical protein